MLNPQPQQLRPELFWPILFVSLAFGASAWGYLIYDPAALTEHWFRNKVALKSTHALAIGHLGLLFLGVLFQAVPVLLHGKANPRWLGLAAPALWILGALSLVSFFAGWRNIAILTLAIAALMIAWALLSFKVWHSRRVYEARGFAWQGLAPALFYLGVMIVLGGAMALGLLRPILRQDPLATLRLHVHLGLWGFAGLAIFGFLPKLLRLFQSSVGYAAWPLKAGFISIHAGLGLLILHWLGRLNDPAQAWAGLALAGAALLFVAQIGLLLRAGKKSVMNSSLFSQLLALVFLIAAALGDAALLADLAGGDWRAQAAVLALGMGGFVSLVLLGVIQRICAVLAWFQRFYESAKAEQVPTAWELVHPALAWSAPFAQALAALCLANGLWKGSAEWIRAAGILGLIAYALTMGLAWGALRRGQARPWPDGKNPFMEWIEEQERLAKPSGDSHEPANL